MITFVKILGYEVPLDKASSFDYYVELGLQTINPHSLHPRGLQLGAPSVFRSNLCRAEECVFCPQPSSCVAIDLLNEVPFDLRAMCTEAEWIKEGSVVVRRRFIEAFEADKLPIKVAILLGQAKEVISLCGGFTKSGDIALVSHSFRMKILEAYIQTKAEIVGQPSLIRNYLHEGRKTFQFGEGFSIEPAVISFCSSSI
jgi:hypothetical protein